MLYRSWYHKLEGHPPPPRWSPELGAHVEIARSPFLIGCISSNDLIIDVHLAISRRHATIERRDDGWWIRDWTSTYGTWVRGENAVDWRRIADGDDIAFGAVGDPDLHHDGRDAGVVVRFVDGHLA